MKGSNVNSNLSPFPLVSTHHPLLLVSIIFQRSTLLRLGNHRSIGSALFHKKLETTHVALISLRSLDDWPRRPRVSCLYAFQIGAQCQHPSFPSFPRPSSLAVEESAATVFSRSRRLLFLPFTRMRL